MANAVTLIRGEGAAGELAEVVRRVIENAGGAVTWRESPRSTAKALVDSIRQTGVCLDASGPPAGESPEQSPVSTELASDLELEVCAHPCKTYPGVQGARPDVELVLFRGTTEGTSAGLGYRSREPETERVARELGAAAGVTLPAEVGLSVAFATRATAARVVEAACEFGRERGTGRLSVCHQAAVLPQTDGLFLHTARNVAVRFPDVGFESRSLDEVGRELVRAPEGFEVLVVPPQAGTLIAEVVSGLVGGPSFAPSFHLGAGAVALFGASWPGRSPSRPSPGARVGELAGPWVVVLAGIWMLRHLGEASAASRLEAAVASVLAADGAPRGAESSWTPTAMGDRLVQAMVAGG